MDTKNISISDYNYELPDERIAKFPVTPRDHSQLLVYDNELKADLLKESRSYIERSERNVLPDAEDLPFREGDRVEHRVFGAGTVEKIDYQEEAVFVKFDSMATSRGISLRAASKLKKILVS